MGALPGGQRLEDHGFRVQLGRYGDPCFGGIGSRYPALSQNTDLAFMVQTSNGGLFILALTIAFHRTAPAVECRQLRSAPSHLSARSPTSRALFNLAVSSAASPSITRSIMESPANQFDFEMIATEQ